MTNSRVARKPVPKSSLQDTTNNIDGSFRDSPVFDLSFPLELNYRGNAASLPSSSDDPGALEQLPSQAETSGGAGYGRAMEAKDLPSVPDAHVPSQEPPDGGMTAWTQVLASFLINVNVFGLVNAFGEFQYFYETQYLTSHSSSTISWIGTVQASLTLFVGMLAGSIFDYGYFKLTLMAASIILVFSWMMLSLSTQYYQIMLTQGILAGFAVGLMEVPSIALIPDYFRRRLGLAIGLAVSGAPAGGLIYSAVFRAILTATNFAWATRALGFINLVTLGIAIFIIKPLDVKRRSKSRKFFDLHALREGPFICFIFDAFFAYCAALIPYFVTPSYAATLHGANGNTNYFITILNASQIVGRIIPAFISDFHGGADMLMIAQVLVGILGLHWIAVATIGGFIEFLIFVGFFNGAVATLPPILLPYLCPSPETFGTRVGMVYAAAGIGTLIGNPIALATTGDANDREAFLGAQLWMGLCALIGAAFYILPSRSIKENRKTILGKGDRNEQEP